MYTSPPQLAKSLRKQTVHLQRSMCLSCTRVVGHKSTLNRCNINLAAVKRVLMMTIFYQSFIVGKARSATKPVL